MRCSPVSDRSLSAGEAADTRLAAAVAQTRHKGFFSLDSFAIEGARAQQLVRPSGPDIAAVSELREG
jgi:hypothetical protein